jgi:hypothetical protein
MNEDARTTTQPAPPGPRPDAIQVEVPPTPPVPPPTPGRSLLRKLLLGAGALLGAYFLAAVLGLVPWSYSSARFGGLRVVVVSYHPSIRQVTAPDWTTIETGGQRLAVRGHVVDLGSGRTAPVPDWCDEVRLSVKGGRVSVTFVPR